MKKFLFVLSSFYWLQAMAGECEPGSYVVYSGACADKTAKVYVRGDRDTTILDRRYVADEGDGTVQCEFTGDYVLTVVEKRGKKTTYSLYGCE